MKMWQNGGAVIVGDYRYRLWRTWDETRPRLLWVMLNPSTADGETDDATIRRCIGFSKDWGYGSIEIVNLFGLRASDPNELRKVADPIGNDNDQHITEAAACAAGIVVAWGENGTYRRRDRVVLDLLTVHARPSALPLLCLGKTQNGCPRHPGRLSQSTRLERYDP